MPCSTTQKNRHEGTPIRIPKRLFDPMSPNEKLHMSNRTLARSNDTLTTELIGMRSQMPQLSHKITSIEKQLALMNIENAQLRKMLRKEIVKIPSKLQSEQDSLIRD